MLFVVAITFPNGTHKQLRICFLDGPIFNVSMKNTQNLCLFAALIHLDTLPNRKTSTDDDIGALECGRCYKA